MRCGGHYDVFQGGQGIEIGMLAGVTKAFQEQHKHCTPLAPGVVRCSACLELGHVLVDHVRLKVLRAVDWLGCGDDGTSSAAIWSVMMGRPPRSIDPPHDPDDFGRCSRLLAAPWALGWRARLPEMGKLSPVWAAIAARWAEMEALFAEEYPTGQGPKLYALMKSLRGLED
jgi:hypothetical protein